MARAGLGPDWSCLFANDFDPKKSATYNLNWGGDVLKTAVFARSKPPNYLEALTSRGLRFPVRTCRLPAVAPASRAPAPAPSGHSGCQMGS